MKVLVTGATGNVGSHVVRALGKHGLEARAFVRDGDKAMRLLGNAEAIKHTGKLFAAAGSARIAYIDPVDVAEVAAAMLATHGHTGMTYTLTGPRAITYWQIAQDLSATVGREIQYVDVPDEAARRNMVESGLRTMVADTIVEVFASYRVGAQARTTDTVLALTGHAARSFAQFAREHAAAFRTSTVEASA